MDESLGDEHLVRTGGVAADDRGRIRLSKGLQRLLHVEAGGSVAAAADRRTGLLALCSMARA